MFFETENSGQIPEQGQLVVVRNRYFVVNDVQPYDNIDASKVLHKLSLECLDDDIMGEEMELIWELERNKNVIDKVDLPKPERNKFDHWETFKAYINSLNWSKSSLIIEDTFLSPFRSAIMLKDYQLEPLARAIRMPRANLLIADDVGLGKTIEAGLIIQEFLAQQRIKRILIVCPATLQKQWQEEMEDKFNLQFEIINRESILNLRREYGVHMNPWDFYPRLITSMDFLKREKPKSLFLESIHNKKKRKGFSIHEWDLLIIDEAHNVAPSGRRTYVRDSDRTKMAIQIKDHFEHRLFLTATPHNGYTPSFTALLELLDPLKFSRGDSFDKRHLQQVMVRRLKNEIIDELGHKEFKERHVDKLDVEMTPDERDTFDLLTKYSKSRIERYSDQRDIFAVTFTLTILKKRLLSSPLAFSKSIKVHMAGLEDKEEERDIAFIKHLQKITLDEWVDDEEKASKEDEAVQESSKLFKDLDPQEIEWLKEMEKISERNHDEKDSKAKRLHGWIKENLFDDNNNWSKERLIIFTEYRDTLSYLEKIFRDSGWDDRYLTLIGGMGENERELIKKTFQEDPKKNKVRILLATDAASEGLNLQNHCRYMIHYEIPWNPNKMEQRNGRIDRVGQTRDVEVFHFVYKDNQDSEYLHTVVDKVQQMREDLGSIGDIIAKEVEDRMLGRTVDRQLVLDESIQNKLKIIREENRSERMSKEDVRRLRLKRENTGKKLDISPGNIRNILDVALKLSNGKIEPTSPDQGDPKYWRISEFPNEWRHLKKYVHKDNRKMNLVFENKYNTGKDNVLIHLNHPLMKKANNFFRENIWKTDLNPDPIINRCSYKVVDNSICSKLSMIVFGRLVATNQYGVKVHEDIIPCGGEIEREKIISLSTEELWEFFRSDGNFPSIPVQLGDDIRRYFPNHKRNLEDLLSECKSEYRNTINASLKEKAESESQKIYDLMLERMNEINERKQMIEREKNRVQKTLFDFTDEEKEQWNEDIRWLDIKYKDIEMKIKEEPEKIKRRYDLKSFDIFPIGTLYVIPESILGRYGDE